jgi:hemolysin III
VNATSTATTPHKSGAPAEKPRLRGVSHQYAFFAFIVAAIGLVTATQVPTARLAALVYGCSVAALFGTSALYHRTTWGPRARRWMRRLDHAMIFVLIAGTYTPICLLALPTDFGLQVLRVVWIAAGIGIVIKISWIQSPYWFTAGLYVALGWVAVVTIPDLLTTIGLFATALIGVGGLLYTAGALIYVVRRPNPLPTVFGYHEIFHALVIVAAALHFVVISTYILPLANT